MPASLRLKLVAAFILSGTVLAWRFVFGTKDEAVLFQIFCGYWWMWAIFGVLGFSAYRLVGSRAIAHEVVRKVCVRHRIQLVFLLLCSLFLHVHEPHEFKVLYDEPAHLHVSQVMHTERQALVAARGHYIGDSFVLLNTFPSFRQYFFPFLLSISHDLFGYSPLTPFFINSVFTLLVLGAVYALGVMLAGQSCGIFCVLLFAAVPLVAQNVTSAGYDICNLFWIILVCIAGLNFLTRSSHEAFAWLDLAAASTLAASQVRYESIVYFAFIVAIILVRWIRSGTLIFSWLLALVPLLLLPSFASNLIFMQTEIYQLPGLRETGQPFLSIKYLSGHLADLVYYIYSFDMGSTASALVAYIGTLGVALMVARAVSTLRLKADPLLLGMILLITIVVLSYCAALMNFWSSPLDGLAARFSLPLWFGLALSGGWLLSQFLRQGTKWTGAAIIFLVCVVVGNGAMVSGAHRTTSLMIPSRVERWFMRFAGSYDRETTLLVSKSNIQLMGFRWASIDLDRVNKAPEKCVQLLQAGIYRNIFILERSEFPASQETNIRRDFSVLDHNIIVEEVARRTFAPGQLTRIVRFIGYRNEKGGLITPDNAPPLRTDFTTDAKRDDYILSLYP